MSKILYICERNNSLDSNSIDRLITGLNSRLLPDNIRPRAPLHLISSREALIVLNPNENTRISDFNLCQGYIVPSDTDWTVMKKDPPVGNFVIIRTDHGITEILTDPVASYTIWYYFNDDLFLASTSQRAIVHYLKSFAFNENVISWMLSAGILGPDHSWDSRINMVHGNATLTLDKLNWNLQESLHVFRREAVKRKEAAGYLRKSMYDLFDRFDLDYNKWILPLSGGGDSRLLLALLHRKKNIRTITWGTREALQDENSDACVAKKVADYFKVPNRYYQLNEAELTPGTILQRILVAGEGRTDTLAGYMDGFRLWTQLFEDNIQGIIRGDHGFGTRSPLRQTKEGFQWGTFRLLSDYKEFDTFRKYVGAGQQFPASFNRRSDESLEQWEIRLRLTFSYPYLMSALNDLKLSYVDVFSPMLCLPVIEAVLNCPAEADKIFIKRFNRDIGPKFPLASSPSVPLANKVLATDGTLNAYICEYLVNSKLSHVLDQELINHVVENQRLQFPTAGTRKKIRKWIKYRFKFLIPYQIKNKLVTNLGEPSINYNVLALRTFIILRMHEILREDAKYW